MTLKSLIVPIMLACAGVLGCSADPSRSTIRERQDAALRDPFDYRPDISNDISGGEIHQLDREALRKDIENVFNP